MNDRTWHQGPPPHVGWWNASILRSSNIWRWWDGTCWSQPVSADSGWQNAEHRAKIPNGDDGYELEWSDYYPKNARVPRIDPSKGETK